MYKFNFKDQAKYYTQSMITRISKNIDKQLMRYNKATIKQ